MIRIRGPYASTFTKLLLKKSYMLTELLKHAVTAKGYFF